MANKKLTLQKWVDKDGKIKIDFIQHEYDKENEKGVLSIPQGSTPYNLIVDRIKVRSVAPLLNANMTIENQQVTLTVTSENFEKLKSRYRTFKLEENNKLQELKKKQLWFSKKNLERIDTLMKQQKLKKIEDCFIYLLDCHKDGQNQHKKEIAKKDQTIQELKQEIFALKDNNKKIREQFSFEQKTTSLIKDFLIQRLVKEITQQKQLLQFIGEISQEEKEQIYETVPDDIQEKIKKKINQEVDLYIHAENMNSYYF
ncbi:hypothetical protein [Acinetobacter zhairhuonensis]|uniref:hypothetical protein n=1 Tax=Acinetobacter sp. A7.4 TaxID=2919921 RepID=UPI001F5035C9|nr:hypothetical protein [Acinetobacter sp. A7.4]MCJ8161977.1 hypothetical protein [Acinetobacter sp. A7.4]